jgi:hypothetical protein
MADSQEIAPFSVTPLIHEVKRFADEMNELIRIIDGLNENTINNVEGELKYQLDAQKRVAIELIKNFLLVTSESLSKQVGSVNTFKRYYENFLLQSSDFNRSIEKENERISGLNSETLKRRAVESVKSEIDNFYSIYNISMKI